MVIFDGTLAFAPNTLNNSLFAYILAKKWEELNYPQEKWMKLINNVSEFNRDLMVLFALPLGKNPMQYNVMLFIDWDINGDGCVYSNYQAKCIFDSE